MFAGYQCSRLYGENSAVSPTTPRGQTGPDSERLKRESASGTRNCAAGSSSHERSLGDTM